jgi:hypothetical protein
MEDCRTMTTPIITKWKKLHAFESQLVDPTLYHQLIGSLMYLVLGIFVVQWIMAWTI